MLPDGSHSHSGKAQGQASTAPRLTVQLTAAVCFLARSQRKSEGRPCLKPRGHSVDELKPNGLKNTGEQFQAAERVRCFRGKSHQGFQPTPEGSPVPGTHHGTSSIKCTRWRCEQHEHGRNSWINDQTCSRSSQGSEHTRQLPSESRTM